MVAGIDGLVLTVEHFLDVCSICLAQILAYTQLNWCLVSCLETEGGLIAVIASCCVERF